jgi:hypothetical protein
MARAKVEHPYIAPPFRCAILLNPTAVGDPFEWFRSGEMERLRELPGGVKIDIPTAMVWGEADAYREQEGMDTPFRLFDESKACNYVHSGVHEVPNYKLENSVQRTKMIANRSIVMAHELNLESS